MVEWGGTRKPFNFYDQFKKKKEGETYNLMGYWMYTL